MADLDSLSIQIEAEGKKAQDAIGRLENSLSGLAGLLSGLKVDGHISKDLASIASNTREIANAIKGIDSSAFNGVSKGAQKVASDTKVAQKAVKELADTTGQVKGVNFISSDSAIQNLVKIKSEYDAIIRGMKSGKVSFDAGAFNNAVMGAELAKAAIKKYEDELRASATAAREVSDATSGISTALSTIRIPNFTFVNSGTTAEFGVLKNTIEETGTALVTLDHTANAAGTALANLWSIGNQNFTMGEGYSNEFVLMRDSVDGASTALVALGSNASTALATAEMSFNNMRNTIIDVEGTVVGVNDAMQIDPSNLQDVILKLNETALSAEELHGVLSSTQYNESFKSLVVELNDAQKALAEVEERLRVLQAEGERLTNAIDMSKTASEMHSATDALKEHTKQYEATIAEAQKLDSVIDSLVNRMISMQLAGQTGFQGLFSNVKIEPIDFSALLAPIRGLAKIAREGVNAVLAPFRSLANGIESILTRISRFWGRVMRTFTFMMIRKAITAIIGDISNAMQSLANFESYIGNRFQQSMSTLATDFRWLGANIVAAFAPIINAVTPIIDALISKLVQAITVINQFFAALTGNTVFVRAKKVAVGYGGALGDVGGAAKKTAKKQKELNEEIKDYLLDIDELNVLRPDEDMYPDLSDLDPNAGRGGGGGGGGVPYEWEELEIPQEIFDLIEKIKELLGDPFLLGRTISEWLADALESIPWERIQKAARFVGEYLADLLNGFITPKLFSAIGHTIAEALNTALHFLDSFGTTFNWQGLGTSIAAGINRFFNDFDFDLLARNINVWAHGLLDAFIIAVSKVDWRLIGEKIGGFLAAIDFMGILKKVGQAIWTAINAGFDTYSSMFKAAPLETALLSLGGIVALMKVSAVTKFGTALAGLGRNVGIMTTALKGGNTGLALFATRSLQTSGKLYTLMSAASETASAFKSGRGIIKSFGTGLQTVGNALSPTTKALGSVVAVFAEFAFVKNIVRDITEGTGSLAGNIAKLVGVMGLASAALYTFLGPAGLVVAAITGVVAAVVGYNQAIEEMRSESLAKGFDTLVASTEGAGHTLHDFRIAMSDTVSSVTQGLDEIKGKFDTLEEIKPKIDSSISYIGGISFAMAQTGTATEKEIQGIISSFGNLKEMMNQYITEMYDAMTLQEIADMNYIASKRALTDEEKEQFGARIQALQTAKDEAIANSQEMIDNALTTSQKISEAVQTYGSDSEEVAALNRELADSFLPVMQQAQQFGIIEDDLSKQVNSVTTEMGKLVGGLDLSAEGIYDNADLNTRLKDTVTSLTDSYKGGVEAITETYGAWLENAKATGASEEVIKNHTQVVADQLATLQTEYETNLTQIGNDINEIIPSAIEELSAVWDSQAAEDGFKGFKTKGEFIKAELEQFANELYGADGFGSAIEDAVKETGANVTTTGKDALIEAIGAMFDSDVQSAFPQMMADGSVEWVAQSEPILKENFSQLFANALDTEAIKGVGIGGGEALNEGIAEGNANIDGVSTQLATNRDAWLEQLHTLYEWHSPSGLTIPLGESLNEGIAYGLKDVSAITSAAKTVANATMSALTAAFSGASGKNFMSGVGTTMMQSLAAEITSGMSTVKSAFDTGFNNIRSSSLSVNTWTNAFRNILNALKQVWSEVVAWWGEAANTWLATNVSTYFTVSRWIQISVGMKEGIMQTWKDFTVQWNSALSTWWTSDVTPWFSQAKWNALGRDMRTGMYEGFKGIFDDIKKTLDNIKIEFANTINSLNSYKASFSSASYSVYAPSYATGGFPEDGLFFANSGELVGHFDNGKTAVVNNEQIQAGIRQSMRSALIDTLAPYLGEIADNTRKSAEKDGNVYLDGRELVTSIDSRRNRNGYSFVTV